MKTSKNNQAYGIPLSRLRELVSKMRKTGALNRKPSLILFKTVRTERKREINNRCKRLF